MSNVKKLETVASELSNRPGDDHSRTLDAPETIIPEGVNLPAGDESILAEEIVWEATHSIGPYTVQERSFLTGLRYWVEENGKRRRPTATNALRKFAPKPDPVKQMWLDKPAFALMMTAYFSEVNERAEDAFGNVAERVDEDHVLLSLFDKGLRSHNRYLIQIPEEFEVIGSKVP